jgi:hypothetical protein
MLGVEARWENLKEGDHLEDPYIDGRIIFKTSSSKEKYT